MKQVDIKTRVIPNKPRSGNYPVGSTVVRGGSSGGDTTIINQGGADLSTLRQQFLSKKSDDTANGIIDFLKGLKIASSVIKSVLKKDDQGDLTDEAIMSALRVIQEIEDNNEDLKAKFIRKDQEDQTEFLVKFLGGIISTFLESPDFVTGMMGAGMSFSSEGGSSVGWIDKLYVRKKAVFQLLEIMKTELAGASFLFNASGARATITKVEQIEQEAYFIDGDKGYFPNGDEAYFPDVYRCYFMVDDGDTAVENLFKVGDLVRSQTFNIESGIHEGVSNHYWWRLVVGTGKDYIDLSSINMDDGSDEPAVGDVIVQLGNIDDVDRQAAIIMSAYGDGAPSLTMYQGIDNYSLSGKDIFSIGYDRIKKRCYLKVVGEAYIGERDRKNYFEFIPGEGLQIKAKEFLYESGKTVVQASQEAISLKLGEAGIDIDNKTVTVTASSFFVNNSENKPISVFTTDSEGNPLLKAEYIDVENLKVKHLDGADGTFEGILKAQSIYTKIAYVGKDIGVNDKIDPETQPTSIFGSNNSFGTETYATIKMPDVSDWEGLKIDGCSMIVSRSDLGLYLESSGDDRFSAGIKKYKYCILPANIVTSLLAFNGLWIPDNELLKYSDDLINWYNYEP